MFYFTPSLAFWGVIDMKSPRGRNTYESERKPLSSSDKFDGKAQGLYIVLKEYLDRGDENGCADAVSGINMIPTDVQDPSTEYNNLTT